MAVSSKPQTTMRTRQCSRSTHVYAPCLPLFLCSSPVQLRGCAFSPSGIVAIGGDDKAVTLLDPSNKYSVIQTLTGLAERVRLRMIICSCSQLATQVRCLAFSLDGNILVAGCSDGHVYIYGLTSGKWAQVSYNKHHSKQV